MEGFHDQEAIQALTDGVIDALRPLGISVDPHQGVQFGIQGSEMVVMVMGLVRPQARERATQDLETRAELNQMLAEENRLKIEGEKKQIADLVQDPQALEKFLMEGDTGCAHENVHEGLCLDCGEEVSE